MSLDLSPLLAPCSIAIVGVSEDHTSIRGRLLQVLLDRGYTGTLFLISRSQPTVLGRPTHPTITALPEAPDLVILAAPAAATPALVEECGRKGVKAVHVVASGFAEERGPEGKALQDRLMAAARQYGIILSGPNSEGFVNCFATLAATFSPSLENKAIALEPTVPAKRRIGVVSQSGAFAFSFLNRSQFRQIAYSYMVSSGNEAMLKSADYLDYMLEDGKTDLFLAYLEGVGDPARFAAVAARAADMGKPLIVATPSRSEAVKRAAASHTGSLAGETRAVEAMFREYGIIRGGDFDSMIDTATAFSHCAPPRGRRVAVVSASGGGAVWMADTLTQFGFEVPRFDDATRERIAAVLPSYGSPENPVDLTATAIRAVGYAGIIEIVRESPVVDIIVVVGSLAYEYGIEKDRDPLIRVMKDTRQPVVFCTYTTASARAAELLAGAGIPTYTSMPGCANALKELADYADFQMRWKRDGRPERPEGIDRNGATQAFVEAGPALCEIEAKRVLVHYGVPLADERLVSTAEEAVAAATAIGSKVAVKAQSTTLLHKTEVGGVALGLDGPAVRAAAIDMLARLAPGANEHWRGLLVQKMAQPGIEAIVGISRDPHFGPMVTIGLGGIFVELIDDVVLAPVPVSPARAAELIRSLRGARMFEGVRGKPGGDVAALADLVSRLSWFAADHAELIEEIDLNPVIVHEHGLTVVDALIVKRNKGV